ncbi:MAG: NAD-dependent epimerase/dehydratase family protein [Chloroflexi bacterium]|nr:NAD-dependent epimerase/dehydratase family protein [Chloroflexota bacterium]
MAALNQRGIEVVGLRRKTSPDDAVAGLDINFVTGDILDIETLRPAMEGIDWVFHVAAISDYWRTPAEVIYRVNVEGARTVMEAALQAGVSRFVLTSSTASLGMPRADKPLMDETDVFNLEGADFPYGYSKHLAEEAMREYVGKGLSATAVLPSAVMGPRDLRFNVGELIIRALKGGLVPTPDGGLNFVDATDCSEGHIAAAEHGKPGERYLLAGDNLTHAETLAIINETLGTSARPLHLPRWTLPPLAEIVNVLQLLGIELPVDKGRVLFSGERIYYDNERARTELGLSFRPFAESVQSAYDWYVAHDYLQKRGIHDH